MVRVTFCLGLALVLSVFWFPGSGFSASSVLMSHLTLRYNPSLPTMTLWPVNEV
ncbi:uncharacterized protein THITE_2122588 [Thermothielavioides terrestris NRRL 8126]|uniref:Uncharacterized protein n=1 Tax=Thermothielavioides terrestris (strain ATCC 38088 / NRRL 8126) TaxID=578455 RepID=G2RDL8_THETT|nr:uncharacterized protein THITE_2122588 [Thermothielavioides terrestris NRRL 8126]AEO70803.1 hypothetical protein THITE_2122588 [Thermothielavioides terrestris NRRL 8126]